MDARQRFERMDTASGGGKIRNRFGTGPSISLDQASPGDFLSRLWALFGPPNEVSGDGFDYYLRDSQTGLRFDAYSGASGPAYAGSPKQTAALAPVLEAFDALLDATAPVDCALEYQTSFGSIRIGSQGGLPFETAKANNVAELQTSLSEATEIVAQHKPDPWDCCNTLLALVNAWERAPEEIKKQETSEYLTAAGKLWTVAFAAAEEFIRRKFDSGEPDHTSTTETLSEVALVQLHEVAEKCGIDWNVFAERYKKTLSRAVQVRER